MGETSVAPPLPEETPGDSFFSRAMGVFISPGTAFESIARKPDFLAALMVGVVSTIVFTETMLAKIGIERIVRRSIELSPRAAQFSAEQMDQAVHRGATFGLILARVSEFVAVPVYILIVAAVGLFIVNLIFGGTATFKASFSVICYANLIKLVEAVLGMVVILFGDPDQFNPQNFAPSNAGFFLSPQDTARPLYIVASSFDVFTIWFLIVASLGLSLVSGRKARTLPVFLCFLGLWIVWVLVKIGLSMLGG